MNGKRSAYDLKGFDDAHLRETVQVRNGGEDGIIRGVGIVGPKLGDRADDQIRGQIAAQTGGNYQVALQQLAGGGEGVQLQLTVVHQGEIAAGNADVLGPVDTGTQGGVGVDHGQNRGPIVAHLADAAHQTGVSVDNAVTDLHAVGRALVQRQGGGPVGDTPLRDGGGLEVAEVPALLTQIQKTAIAVVGIAMLAIPALWRERDKWIGNSQKTAGA